MKVRKKRERKKVIGLEKINMVFGVKKKKVRSASFERCVRKVKKEKGVKNPFAVCQSALGKKAFVQKKTKREDRKKFMMKSDRERKSFVRGREFRSLIGLAIGLGVLSAVLRGFRGTTTTTTN